MSLLGIHFWTLNYNVLILTKILHLCTFVKKCFCNFLNCCKTVGNSFYLFFVWLAITSKMLLQIIKLQKTGTKNWLHNCFSRSSWDHLQTASCSFKIFISRNLIECTFNFEILKFAKKLIGTKLNVIFSP